MSSKDLEGIRMLTEFIEAGIDSLKVEGRNKSHYYAATVSKDYSEALAYYKKHGNFLSDDLIRWEEELRKISHRDYTTGSLDEHADESSIYNQRESDDNEYVVSGVILEVIEDQHILLEVRSAFTPGDTLEIMPFTGGTLFHQVHSVRTIANIDVPKSKPGSVVKVPYIAGAERFNIIRRKLAESHL